jgi:hypothetical protein
MAWFAEFSRKEVWITALILCVIVGFTLNLNAYSGPLRNFISTKPWQIGRFFVIPFCVSSYSAIMKAAGEHGTAIYVFPRDINTLLIGIASSVAFGLVLMVTRTVAVKFFTHTKDYVFEETQYENSSVQ